MSTLTLDRTATTGDDLLDSLIAAIAAKPGQEIGQIARRAGADKGIAGRLLTWAAGAGYVAVGRGKGGRRVYSPVAR